MKIVSTNGNVSIVFVGDNPPQAYIIDTQDLGAKKLPENAVSYGIDWSVVFPEGVTISSDVLQEAMYARGIISIDDLKAHSAEIHHVLNSILSMTSAKIYQQVKTVMEDYNGNV